MPHATYSKLLSLSIKNFQLWRYFQVHTFTENMRTLPKEIEVKNFVVAIGDGSINDKNNNVILPE